MNQTRWPIVFCDKTFMLIRFLEGKQDHNFENGIDKIVSISIMPNSILLKWISLYVYDST